MSIALPDEAGFSYRGGVLHCEGVSVVALAQRFDTPLYIYSRGAITRAFKAAWIWKRWPGAAHWFAMR